MKENNKIKQNKPTGKEQMNSESRIYSGIQLINHTSKQMREMKENLHLTLLKYAVAVYRLFCMPHPYPTYNLEEIEEPEITKKTG